MNSFAETPISITKENIASNALELVPMLRDRSEEIDTQRRIPQDIVETLKQAGVFRMMMPKEWGGPEMNPMEVNDILEILAAGNASVAWCVMIQNDSGQYSGLLPPHSAQKLYGSLDVTTSNVVQARGTATKTEGGYIVSGLWPFASGCMHTDLFAGGCKVLNSQGEVLKNAAGEEQHRMVILKRENYTILDTWYTTGLKGTGSNDIEAKDIFVPEEHTFSFNLFDSQPRKGALYLWPAILNTKMPGVPLGIAKSSIDIVSSMLKAKGINDGGPILAVADAMTLYASAKSYVQTALTALWEKLCRSEFPSIDERIAVFLSRTNAFHASRQAVQLMYDTMGGQAIYTKKNELDRHLRDVNTACQHILAQRKAQQAAAELKIGVQSSPFPFL